MGSIFWRSKERVGYLGENINAPFHSIRPYVLSNRPAEGLSSRGAEQHAILVQTSVAARSTVMRYIFRLIMVLRAQFFPVTSSPAVYTKPCPVQLQNPERDTSPQYVFSYIHVHLPRTILFFNYYGFYSPCFLYRFNDHRRLSGVVLIP